MKVENLISKMRHQDLWVESEFAEVLSHMNPEVGDAELFRNLIATSNKAGKLHSAEEGFCYRHPTKEGLSYKSNYLLEWAKNKKFKLPIELKASCGELSTRAEQTYLNIISAMHQAFFNTTTSGNPISCFKDQAALIEYLSNNYSASGLSKRTLEGKFALANKSCPPE